MKTLLLVLSVIVQIYLLYMFSFLIIPLMFTYIIVASVIYLVRTNGRS
jgi:hypothetical protein